MILNTLAAPDMEVLLKNLDYIFKNPDVGIAICNEHSGAVEISNSAFGEILGYGKEKFPKRLPDELLSPTIKHKDGSIEREFFHTRTDDVSFETTYERGDGSFITLSVRQKMIKNEQSKIISRIIYLRDITEKEALHTLFMLQQLALEHINEAIFFLDQEGKFCYINKAASNYLGFSKNALLAMRLYDIYPELSPEKWAEHLESLKDSKKLLFETTLKKADKTCVPVTITAHYLYYDQSTYTMLQLNETSEIKTQKVPLQKEEQEFRTLAENSPNIIMRYNLEGCLIYVNPAFTQQTDIPKELVLGKHNVRWDQYLKVSTISEEVYQQGIQKVIKNGTNNSFIIEWYKRSDNTYVAHNIHIVAERDINDNIIGALVIGHDISENKRVEQRMEHMAHHDALTGLPNRLLAKEKSEQAISLAKQEHNKMALLFIDMDGFKTINDTMGHSVGDIMLKNITARLIGTLRENDTLSRQGGDEFLLILSDIRTHQEIVSVAKKLLHSFDEPFYLGEQILSISASIGIAIYPEHGDNFESLLQNADTAMYRAKDSGKNAFSFYTQEMKHELIGQFKFQNDIKSALQNSEFTLYYQPQIDLKSHRIIGVEALIRWNHTQLGMLLPMSFIPIAESNGLIDQIGDWVLLEACKQAAKWHRQEIQITVAVNISAIQFKRGNLGNIIHEALHLSGLEPRYLELELTESILIDDAESILIELQRLKALGIQLSIDDFGTGYSSLAYLKRFAVDKLKIDQSFIRDILRDQEDATIVRTIIQMAKNLNLKTIAEGVEEREILDIIHEYGCDEVQGYHFAKPMNATDFEEYYNTFYQQTIEKID